MLHSGGSKKSDWILCLPRRKLQTGRAVHTHSGLFQSHQEAMLSITPSHAPPRPLLLPGQCLGVSNFTFRLTDSEREARGLLQSNRDTFSAGSVVSPDSQPSVGCKVSVLPMELQTYFFLQSCFLLAPGKMARPFLSAMRGRCNKIHGACFPIKQGKCLRWA